MGSRLYSTKLIAHKFSQIPPLQHPPNPNPHRLFSFSVTIHRSKSYFPFFDGFQPLDRVLETTTYTSSFPHPHPDGPHLPFAAIVSDFFTRMGLHVAPQEQPARDLLDILQRSPPDERICVSADLEISHVYICDGFLTHAAPSYSPSDRIHAAASPSPPSAAAADAKMTSVVFEADPSSSSACAICLEDFQGGSVLTKLWCSHIFHPNCISTWLRESHTCVICRSKLPRQ